MKTLYSGYIVKLGHVVYSGDMKITTIHGHNINCDNAPLPCLV